MTALDVIRATYAAGKRKLPPSPPIRFVPRRWRAQVVAGSGRYRAFGDYLLPEPTFAALRASGPLPLAVPARFEDHLAERQARLEEAATAVAELARAGRLPDVRLDKTGLTITPLRAVTPPAVKAVRPAGTQPD